MLLILFQQALLCSQDTSAKSNQAPKRGFCSLCFAANPSFLSEIGSCVLVLGPCYLASRPMLCEMKCCALSLSKSGGGGSNQDN